jgi:CheY-like chemotaxis protein
MDLSEPKQRPNRETTILVADDDSAVLSFLADVLRRHEFSVVTASDGAQALDRARDHGDRIDLLLTDFEMPHMNGIQLAATIRQFLPHIVVILMSGSSSKDAVTGGASMFLRKPFTPPVLLETIAGLLGGS